MKLSTLQSQFKIQVQVIPFKPSESEHSSGQWEILRVYQWEETEEERFKIQEIKYGVWTFLVCFLSFFLAILFKCTQLHNSIFCNGGCRCWMGDGRNIVFSIFSYFRILNSSLINIIQRSNPKIFLKAFLNSGLKIV